MACLSTQFDVEDQYVWTSVKIDIGGAAELKRRARRQTIARTHKHYKPKLHVVDSANIYSRGISGRLMNAMLRRIRCSAEHSKLSRRTLLVTRTGVNWDIAQ